MGTLQAGRRFVTAKWAEGPAAGEARSAAARGRSRCRWRGGRRRPRLPHARPEDGGVSPGREARNHGGPGSRRARGCWWWQWWFFPGSSLLFLSERECVLQQAEDGGADDWVRGVSVPTRGASCLKGQALHLDQKQHGPFQFFQARVWCNGRVSEPGPRDVNPLGQGCAPWQRGGCYQSLPSAALAHPHFQLELICPSGSCSDCHCGALLELSPQSPSSELPRFFGNLIVLHTRSIVSDCVCGLLPITWALTAKVPLSAWIIFLSPVPA